MRWAKWPYWLRGGVIAAGITIVSGLLIISCGQIAAVSIHDISGESVGFACLPLVILSPMFPFAVLMEQLSFTRGLPLASFQTLLFISSTVGWFIVGAGLGEFVGYAKSRKT